MPARQPATKYGFLKRFFRASVYYHTFMALKVLLTSFKGGTGVTTFAVGLGFALAEMGERTLVLDGDIKNACATVIGECRDNIVYTLADYEKGGCRAKQTLVSPPQRSNLSFMPALGLNRAEFAEKAVADVDGLFDYILLDNAAQNACDCAIIVTDPYPASVKSADLCRSALTDGGVKKVELAVNKLSAGLILGGESMTAREIATLLRLELAAVIPEDLLLPAGKWKSGTKKAFKTAAERLTGKHGNVYNVLSGMNGLGGYFKRKMREKL